MSGALKEIGVVVVGLGIAGKVRVRDLKEETCGLRLRGVVSRRPVELEGVKSYSLGEALSDPSVGAVVIATEPQAHEEVVKQSLEAGKHVLVEYPLALSSEKAKEFFNLAEQKGVILREENIALLTGSYLKVKQKASQCPLESATYSLKGKYNGWVETLGNAGRPFITGVSGLQVMISLFGELEVKSGEITKQEDGYLANASLQTKQGKPISIIQGRFPECPRQKEEVYSFTDGEVLDTATLMKNIIPNKTGLFAQDMHLFYSNIQDGKIPPEDKNLTISSLVLAEKIHSCF